MRRLQNIFQITSEIGISPQPGGVVISHAAIHEHLHATPRFWG
jgi:hypothetical protein